MAEHSDNLRNQKRINQYIKALADNDVSFKDLHIKNDEQRGYLFAYLTLTKGKLQNVAYFGYKDVNRAHVNNLESKFPYEEQGFSKYFKNNIYLLAEHHGELFKDKKVLVLVENANSFQLYKLKYDNTYNSHRKFELSE